MVRMFGNVNRLPLPCIGAMMIQTMKNTRIARYNPLSNRNFCILKFCAYAFLFNMGLVVPNVKDLGYPQCAITGGGFLSVVGGASEKTAKDVEDLMKKVWADPDFRNFTLEQGLNIYECYGADLAKHIKEAEANAKLAAQGLGLIK